MDAMSFTPKHFFTRETIILSFPLSPASPASGTDTGGVDVSTSAWMFDMAVDVGLWVSGQVRGGVP